MTSEITSSLGTQQEKGPILSLSYLRGFVILLVVAHHAALGYAPFVPTPNRTLLASPRLWEGFPVADPSHWAGSTLFIVFNDTFFMALMFFASGLFLWQGLSRKGLYLFLKDRVIRLGLPFLIASAFLAPLAYYPSYLQSTSHTADNTFLHQWFALGGWPSGPAWFLWVLLSFDLFSSLLFKLLPHIMSAVAGFVLHLIQRATLFFLVLVSISALIYLPIEMHFGAGTWTSFGPLAFQISRYPLYFCYFLLAAAIGATGGARRFLSVQGSLAKLWHLWLVIALAFFITLCHAAAQLASHPSSVPWAFAAGFGFVLSCAASSFALLATFAHFTRTSNAFFSSLSTNSYGIYLFHYALVTWLQYALLKAALPGIAKAIIVFFITVPCTWLLTIALRRIPVISRVI